MNKFIEKYKAEFEGCFQHLKDEFKTLRIGRATPGLLDNILVDAYGSKMPLNQLASITVPDARTLLISPWDRTVAKDIEKAITYANLGFTPISKGDTIMITMPPLSEENRKDMVKVVLKKSEEAKVSARNVRDKVKIEIKKAEDSKVLTEDDYYIYVKELDEYTQDFNTKVKVLSEEKEKEIMKV